MLKRVKIGTTFKISGNSVGDIISRDGWTPNHLYDDAVALFTELRETGLKSMLGKEREDFKRQTQWVEKI